MVSTFPNLGILAIVLFLLPGLLGIRAYFFISKKADPFSRIETIAFSFFISILSILSLYLMYSICFRELATLSLLIQEVNTLPSAIGHYVSIFIISVVLGAAGGKLTDYNSDEIRSRRDIWEFYLSKLVDDTNEYVVRVVTTQGERVSGKLVKYGSSAQQKDIVLQKPKTQLVDDSGEKIEVENWTGQVYLQESDIQQVHFDSLWDADKIHLQDDGMSEEQQEAQDEAMTNLKELAQQPSSDEPEDTNGN